MRDSLCRRGQVRGPLGSGARLLGRLLRGGWGRGIEDLIATDLAAARQAQAALGEPREAQAQLQLGQVQGTVVDAQGKVESDHPRSPNKKRPYLPDRFEVMDVDNHRIDQLLVSRLDAPDGEISGQG